jgi:hypothetical protein
VRPPVDAVGRHAHLVDAADVVTAGHLDGHLLDAGARVDVVDRDGACRDMRIDDLAVVDREVDDPLVVDGRLARRVCFAGTLVDLVVRVGDRAQHVLAVGEAALVEVDPLLVAVVVVGVAPAHRQALD